MRRLLHCPILRRARLFASCRFSTIPSPAPTATHSTPTQSPNQDKNESKTNARKPSRLRYYLTFFGFWLGYWYYRRSRKAALVEELQKKVVSAEENELINVISNANLDTSSCERIYSEVHARLDPDNAEPEGSALVDPFLTIVADIVNQKKAVDKAKREELRAKELTLRAEMFQQIEAEPDSADRKKLLETLKKTCDVHDSEYQAEVDEDAKAQFRMWEPLAMYRTFTPVGSNKFQTSLNVMDLFSGVALLVRDLKPDSPPETAADYKTWLSGLAADGSPTNTRWGRENKRRIPNARLRFAFRLHDENADGYLSYPELVSLLERLIRTGHVDPASLVAQTAFLPPSLRVKTPVEIADIILKDLGRNPVSTPLSSSLADKLNPFYPEQPPVTDKSRFNESVRPNINMDPYLIAHGPAHFSSSSSSSTPQAASNAVSTKPVISVEEFLTVCDNLTKEQKVVFWYLVDNSAGWFAKHKLKRKMQFNRLQRLLASKPLKPEQELV